MAVGKNKKMQSKGGKKGGKKKVVDPFTKKDWYDIKVPTMFPTRNVGKTLVTRTIGNKIAADGLKGRVYDLNQADLVDDDSSYKKFSLVCEDVQGKNCILNFHGMHLTRGKIASMVRKWQSMISGHVEVKTTDGFTLRVFIIAFTNKRKDQVRKTTYASSQQKKIIRKKMVEIVTKEVQSSDIKELINKLIPDSIAREIEKACTVIYPLHDVHVSKVKVVKRPKIDLHKLAELHGEASKAVNSKGEKVDRADGFDVKPVESV